MKSKLASLPNCITFLRFLLSSVFCPLLYGLFTGGRGFIPAITVFLAVCATDVLDGRIARRLGAASAFGAYLDLIADVFYVVSSLSVLIILHIIPVWFLVLVLAKFGEYIMTSRVISHSAKLKPSEFVRDPLGRCAAVLYFLLPGAICVFHSIPGLDFNLAVDLAISAAALITLFSFFVRCRYCIKTIKIQKEAT
jgi:phosphatidylglycerophosphate synthase